VGCTKGGVIKVFDKAASRLIAAHAGYMARNRRGGYLSTQFHVKNEVHGLDDCAGREVSHLPERQLRINQPAFFVVHERTASPGRMLLFRLFTLTVGRNLWLANWIKRNIITALFIHRRRPARLRLARTITFSGQGPSIEDSLEGAELQGLVSLRAGDIFTTIYMASAKYYRHQEAIEDGLSKENLADLPHRDGALVLRYELGNGRLVRVNSE
jgi:hypothetical protein